MTGSLEAMECLLIHPFSLIPHPLIRVSAVNVLISSGAARSSFTFFVSNKR